MDEVRFGWIGETRRTTLRSLMAAEVADWSHDWWIHHSSADVDVRSNHPHDAGARKASPFVSNNELGSIAFHLGGKEIDAIGRHLAGAVGDDDAEWAQHIGQGALEDLAARMLRRAGISKPAKLSRLPPSEGLGHARLGAFAVTLALGSLKLDLAVDRQLVDRLVPPHASARVSLVPRHDALGSVPLRVSAVMDFGKVSLTHLSDLRVGEVIVGDRGLDEVLGIYIEGRSSVATGYLRRSGIQRAVMLDGINSQDGHKP